MATEPTTDTRIPLPDLSPADGAVTGVKSDPATGAMEVSKADVAQDTGAVSSSGRVPAAQRMRAFEDAELGMDAVRINGEIERGSGSLYGRLSKEKRDEWDGLNALAAAEVSLAIAEQATAAAQADVDMKRARVDALSEVADKASE